LARAYGNIPPTHTHTHTIQNPILKQICLQVETDRVKNEALQRVKGERNILHAVQRRKT